ncbi:triosephosphate isomerase [Oxalobacteraceae bacterium GrIS 2.11]
MEHRRPLIAGNWKMNGSLASNAALLSELQSGLAAELACDVAVCVPAPYLAQAQSALHNSVIRWGGQDVSHQTGGAYTGETSASMLKDFSCFYTIVGHSERRTYHAESDELVAGKALRLLELGIVPIICVGETLLERKAGETEQVVARQLTVVLQAIGQNALKNVVVAYEPVWAIGTGVTATPEMAQRVHAYLRAQIAGFDADVARRIQILYGGSMKPDNAASLLAMPDIDGGLIGGASLKSADFLGIIAAAHEANA